METTLDNDYPADSNPDLINPERGMYSGSKPNFGSEDLPPDKRNYHTIVAEWLWLAPWCDKDLVWDRDNPDNRSQVLKDYGPGTPEAPGKLESARLNGHKILFRPRYDKKDNDPNDPTDRATARSRVEAPRCLRRQQGAPEESHHGDREHARELPGRDRLYPGRLSRQVGRMELGP